MITTENRSKANLFAYWYSENKQYLINVLRRYYCYDEDILGEIFFSIYFRILYEGVSIKEYTPYMLRAFKYAYLTNKKKSSRLVLVENYDQLQNIYYSEN